MNNTNGLIIEIFKENELVDSRVIPAKGDRGAMTLYSQIAYAHLGGKFPVEMSLSLEEGQPAHSVGKYYVHSSSFKVGNYGRLEFDRKITLIPVS
ncbi:fumarate reductase [Vibrio lentus]|uniref:single-stranded DNA-binding protein n=1 Tax=Vibrio TaxID=662 RepID=UPI000A38BE15|nr:MULTISPECIES: single-stranded DNA-binding protein [Vibrio]CAH7181249.1 Single-stranded DNA-binding protein [Vibrio chagasii]PMF23491.1 fumarate reductase [Vibrio cyclitrophicus]PMH25242.1 fumarate reductase [Vibrio lentus]PMK66274.1 fumarate reductase [Vibrio lentus]CAH7182060.1 Single-stranded DNA-binding protein [Vibrio chagasii]